MITKNIFKIHFFFYITGLICFLTGNFKNFIIFSSIIIVHELGHIIGALIFKWKIEKIILLPFGGITIFNENIDKSLKEEFVIAILGPLFQFVFYLLYRNNEIFNYYNIAILLFNLLPIYPLDGSKIFNVIFNLFLPYKLSHVLSIILSFVFIIGIILYKIDLSIILIFIIIELFKEILKHKYYFNKFLLERYLNDFNYKKHKVIKKIYSMKKQTKHIFYINNKFYTEKEIIRKLFDK